MVRGQALESVFSAYTRPLSTERPLMATKKNRRQDDSPMPPRPEQIRAERQAAGLTQTAAAILVHAKLRTWQDWESGTAKMHPAFWELWMMKTEVARASNRGA